ncbi:hypothetical protein IWX91DRAFT_332197 [Phyllosticta citricarpa]
MRVYVLKFDSTIARTHREGTVTFCGSVSVVVLMLVYLGDEKGNFGNMLPAGYYRIALSLFLPLGPHNGFIKKLRKDKFPATYFIC